jgi:hypothetical protein
MTTEILRSMLYKGADIIRDIEWVSLRSASRISPSSCSVVIDKFLHEICVINVQIAALSPTRISYVAGYI